MVFGTLLDVVTWGATEKQAESTFAELRLQFQQAHRDWHAWEPGALEDINQAFADGRDAPAGPHLAELIKRSQQIEVRSDGNFNPAIGGLIELWGFHTSEYPVMGPPPSAEEIKRWVLQAPSSRDIFLSKGRVRSENRAVQLDFGGIAKGYAIDLAVQTLREHQVENAIVNAGGDLRAFGKHGSRPWRLGIRDPQGGVTGSISVDGDEAIFTSGIYERFRMDETTRYPHILNPHTGWPVEHIASVTVIADEGILADAAATALMVAGPAGWTEVAANLKLDQVLMISEDGSIYLTEKMSGRLEWVESIDPERVIRIEP